MGNTNPANQDMTSKIENLDNAEKIFLILLEAYGGEAVPGNLWLQKEMFLIAKNLEPLENFLEFKPHIQGPFSETVKNILENLQFRGYVRKDGRHIELTSEGEELVQYIYDNASEDLVDLIEDIKRFVNDLSKDELLVYIYYSYPEMTEESYELEDIEAKRLDLAKRLYQKEKVSLEKASELAGRPLSEFKREISA